MASKGQKFQKVAPELKLKILKEYDDGFGSPRTLGRKYGISYNTIKTWLSNSDKFALVVRYCNENHIHDIQKLNGLLEERNLPIIE